MAKRIEFGAAREQFLGGFAFTPAINGEIADDAVGGVDDIGDAKRHRWRGRWSRRELGHGYHG